MDAKKLIQKNRRELFINTAYGMKNIPNDEEKWMKINKIITLNEKNMYNRFSEKD